MAEPARDPAALPGALGSVVAGGRDLSAPGARRDWSHGHVVRLSRPWGRSHLSPGRVSPGGGTGRWADCETRASDQDVRHDNTNAGDGGGSGASPMRVI